MLKIAGLSTRYGRSIRVLHEVELEIPTGSVVAILGNNGAGKSTLLRAISGTLGLHRGSVDQGTLTLDGRSIAGWDASRIVRAGLVQAPEGRQIFTRMTVEENLRVGGLVTPRGQRAAAQHDVFEMFPRLAERRGQRAGLLSGGEQQMLAIGRALMARPKVLLLDEPSLGLAPKLIRQIGEIVQAINAQGTSVVLVEQNASMALKVADQAVILEMGRVAMAGSAREFLESPDIAALYLGGHADSGATAPAVRKVPSVRTVSRWVA